MKDLPMMYFVRVEGDAAAFVCRIDPYEAFVVDEVHKSVKVSPRKPRAWCVYRAAGEKTRPAGCAIDWSLQDALKAARKALRERRRS